MKFAVPTNNGQLCLHFGHCEIFTFIEVDEESKKITKQEEVVPPPHEPGILPPWIAKNGVDVIIAGGMGKRAKDLFLHEGIKVFVGAQSGTPQELVNEYLQGSLKLGINACDH